MIMERLLNEEIGRYIFYMVVKLNVSDCDSSVDFPEKLETVKTQP